MMRAASRTTPTSAINQTGKPPNCACMKACGSENIDFVPVSDAGAASVVAVVSVASGAVSVGAQSRAGAAQPVAAAIKASWDGAKKNMRESAEFMPEAHFSFKPADTVRTFGQIVAHTAGANYVFCSAIRGEKSPQSENADHFRRACAAGFDQRFGAIPQPFGANGRRDHVRIRNLPPFGDKCTAKIAR